MRIYIRHSYQAYNNTTPHKMQFDPPLSEDGKFYAEQKAKDLIEEYGIPDRIISSPYLRTRQTAEIIAKEAGYTSEIEIETELSCYIHPGYKNVLKNIRPETKFYEPAYNETHDQLHERIEEYYNTLEPTNELIFIITHSFCIYHLSSVEGTPMTDKIEHMEGYISKL